MAVTITETSSSKNHRHFIVAISTTTISTTVTSHPGIARDWIHRTLYYRRRNRHRLILGLGVQWTPFILCQYDQQAATLQLCIGRRCLIFQLHHSTTVPLILRRLLSDPSTTFVGLWSHSDASKLRQSNHRLEMISGMPIDLRLHVHRRDGRSLAGASIEEIALEVLGFEIEWYDDVSKSEWDDEELSFDQVRQACVDAYLSFAIGLDVKAWELNANLDG